MSHLLTSLPYFPFNSVTFLAFGRVLFKKIFIDKEYTYLVYILLSLVQRILLYIYPIMVFVHVRITHCAVTGMRSSHFIAGLHSSHPPLSCSSDHEHQGTLESHV